MNFSLLRPWFKPVLFLLALVPFLSLLLRAISDSLGPNPAEALMRGTGDWTLRMVVLTLLITPLRQWTGWQTLASWRRMLGLFAFFYSVTHFLCFAWLDMGFEWAAIVRDIAKRPFILAGSTALLLMLPLAATSSNRAVRALGGARWRRLHKLVYGVAALGLLHFFWMRSAKHDYAEVLIYAAVLAVLMGARVVHWRRSAAQRQAR